MKRLCYFLTALVVLASCGPSYEEQKRQVRKQRLQMLREDSAALKVAVMPTLDCLPLFVAKAENLFGKNGADVRLKMFTAQMDCDTAVVGGSVEGVVSDLVRTERMVKLGTQLDYVTATDAYWQLYTGRMARITKLPQLDDRMVAMTRYSVTDMLADAVVDSAKLKQERLFKIQVNDVGIRLSMLLGGEIEAALLTEPQASVARQAGHKRLMDSRKWDIQMGVIAFRHAAMQDSTRQRQLAAFTKGYNQACDSLNRYGVERYRDLLVKYCKIKNEQADSLLLATKFKPVRPPREADVERARSWISKQ
jgi:NitT/TauT family transport system substrate-binding protein